MQAHDLVSLWTPLPGPFSSIPKGGSRWISHGDRQPQCHLWAVVTLGRQVGTREVTEFGSGLWSHDGTQDCGTYSDCRTGTVHSADELWLLTTSRHTSSPLLGMALSLLKVSKPLLCSHYTITSRLVFPRASRTRTECEEWLEMMGKIVLCSWSQQ